MSTADVTDGKPLRRLIAVHLRGAVSHLVAFYDIHGRKGEVLFFCSVPDTTREHHPVFNNWMLKI
jgi:hypothetical protein